MTIRVCGSSATIAIVSLACLGGTACGSCSKGDAGGPDGGSAAAASAGSSGAVAELLPRCRGDAQRLAIPGEDVVVGDVAIGPSGLLVGLVRSDGGKRVASVMKASLDFATSRVVDVGTPLGDDPPPSPRWNGATGYVAFLGRQAGDAGPRLRALKVARLEESALGKVEATVLQQADESTAFDVAWAEGGPGLAAWDEDAPPNEDAGPTRLSERGFVKVQPLADPPKGERARVRVASPESSDAESPRLLARPGGYWLAWLARRVEEDAHYVEGPGEKRAYRWVEVTMLDVHGESAGPVRRVSPEKGRAASFELAPSGADLVVMVQDEAAPSEGAGARIVRHLVRVDGRAEAADLVDGGVGASLAELVPAASPAEAARWLAWTDPAERAHMTPLGAGLLATGRSTPEPSLDGARVLAAAGGDGIYALTGASPTNERDGRAHPERPELRRYLCK